MIDVEADASASAEVVATSRVLKVVNNVALNATATTSAVSILYRVGTANIAASAQLSATGIALRGVADISLAATASFVNRFTIVAESGTRSNGIVIAVEYQNRTIPVESKNRTTYAEAA